MIQLARLKSEDVTNVSLEVGQPLVDLKETASEDNKKYAALYVGKGNAEGEKSTEKVKFYDSKYVDENLVNTIKIASDKTASPIKGQIELAAGSNITLQYGGPSSSNKITINSSYVNTKCTSVDNHYTPTANSSYQLNVDAKGTDAAAWNTTSMVTGVNIQRDAKGHVTGVTVDSVKMPANPNSHYKAKNVVGDSLSIQGSATDNDNTYLKLVENGENRSQIKIKGSGTTLVSSDGSTITISSSKYELPAASETTLGGVKLVYKATIPSTFKSGVIYLIG